MDSPVQERPSASQRRLFARVWILTILISALFAGIGPGSAWASVNIETINIADSMLKKLDPNQNSTEAIGPYDELGFRPDGRARLVQFMVELIEAPGTTGWCDVIATYHTDDYFTSDASRARQNWERDWGHLMSLVDCP